MTKRHVKIIAVILLFIVVLFSISMPVMAKTADQIIDEGKSWIDVGQQISPIKSDKIAPILKPIANVLLAIGTVVVFIVGIVIAIKYITASPDQKGQLKGQLIGLFVSAVVLFGAYGIWSIVYRILNNIV